MSKDKPHITKLKWCDMWHCSGEGLSPHAIGVSPVDAYSKWLLLKMEGELALASRHWLLRDPIRSFQDLSSPHGGG